MAEFNPDGSIKLGGQHRAYIEENNRKLTSQKCIKIKRDVINFSAPKKCVLHINLSNAITDNRFVDTIFKHFKETAHTPTKITKISDRTFEVEIGTDFKRCTECTSLIGRYREFLDGNIIVEQGNCTFENQKKNFSYEDHFE